jgi:hypothetical protein
MSVRTEIEEAGVAAREAVDAAEAALEELLGIARDRLADVKERVLASTIEEAIKAGEAALDKLRS